VTTSAPCFFAYLRRIFLAEQASPSIKILIVIFQANAQQPWSEVMYKERMLGIASYR
jgi:hypothetical protein